jgi:hypothetical protein
MILLFGRFPHKYGGIGRIARKSRVAGTRIALFLQVLVGVWRGIPLPSSEWRVATMGSWNRISMPLVARDDVSRLETEDPWSVYPPSNSNHARNCPRGTKSFRMIEAAELEFVAPAPPTAEEIEFHAALCERLARLHQERTGFWSTIRNWIHSPGAR